MSSTTESTTRMAREPTLGPWPALLPSPSPRGSTASLRWATSSIRLPSSRTMAPSPSSTAASSALPRRSSRRWRRSASTRAMYSASCSLTRNFDHAGWCGTYGRRDLGGRCRRACDDAHIRSAPARDRPETAHPPRAGCSRELHGATSRRLLLRRSWSTGNSSMSLEDCACCIRRDTLRATSPSYTREAAYSSRATASST